jgi:hypothetical protein
MDALGAAASVVSLVTILGQLVQSARQLHDFWSSIQDVPESLQWLVHDLEMIREILGVIDPQSLQGSVADRGGPTLQLLRKCVRYIEKLEALVKPLQFGPGASRRERSWKSIKAVFLTDKIKSYWENLESAKVTLLLAQSHMNQ